MPHILGYRGAVPPPAGPLEAATFREARPGARPAIGEWAGCFFPLKGQEMTDTAVVVLFWVEASLRFACRFLSRPVSAGRPSREVFRSGAGEGGDRLDTNVRYAGSIRYTPSPQRRLPWCPRTRRPQHTLPTQPLRLRKCSKDIKCVRTTACTSSTATCYTGEATSVASTPSSETAEAEARRRGERQRQEGQPRRPTG